MREVQIQLHKIGFTAKFSATNRYLSASESVSFFVESVSFFVVLIFLQETRKCAPCQRQNSRCTVRNHKRGPSVWSRVTRVACRSQNREEYARPANINKLMVN
jgi:hypothetical protein